MSIQNIYILTYDIFTLLFNLPQGKHIMFHMAHFVYEWYFIGASVDVTTLFTYHDAVIECLHQQFVILILRFIEFMKI